MLINGGLCGVQVRERELLLDCGKNPYKRCLLLVQMAFFQDDAQRQLALLEVRVLSAIMT